MLPVDYDKIAATFDTRYRVDLYDGVRDALCDFVLRAKPERVLEVGCGTGHWLTAIRPIVRSIYGLDYSLGMLRLARQKDSGANLARAKAEILPFRSDTFDLILCVNAIHHFGRVDAFITEARRLLRCGGALAVIGMDPHHGRDRWCVYDYFPKTKVADLTRYPSCGQVTDMMLRAGFDRYECRVACHFTATMDGLCSTILS